MMPESVIVINVPEGWTKDEDKDGLFMRCPNGHEALLRRLGMIPVSVHCLVCGAKADVTWKTEENDDQHSP